jgi:hypothetical protein
MSPTLSMVLHYVLWKLAGTPFGKVLIEEHISAIDQEIPHRFWYSVSQSIIYKIHHLSLY